MNEKTCTQCGETKPLADFYRNSNNRTDGRQGKCRPCQRLYDKRWRDAHPERQRNRRSVPGARWEEKYRRRIESFGFEPIVKPFTHDQLVARYGDGCVYCGGRFEEIDHVKPISRGGEHSIENVRPCCAACNRKKWNREVEVVNK